MCRAAMMLIVAGVAVPVQADDGQLWASAVAQGPIGAAAGVQPIAVLELQQRLTNDLSRPSLSLVRVGLGVRLASDITIQGGYHFQHAYPLARITTDEHRLWQQLAFPLFRNPERLLIGARLRLEQRWIAGAQDMGWRARAMLRLQVPLAGLGSGGPLLWTEALLPLNDTDWGQRRRIRQFRYFAGAVVPIDRRFTVEAGYMLRTDALPGGTRRAHVANVQLNYRFGD